MADRPRTSYQPSFSFPTNSNVLLRNTFDRSPTDFTIPPPSVPDPSNPFLNQLEQSQTGLEALFNSRIPSSLSYGQQTALSGLFQPTFQRYLGALGKQIESGTAPDLTFSNFLTQQFNPQRELLRLPTSAFGSPQVRTPTFYFGSR